MKKQLKVQRNKPAGEKKREPAKTAKKTKPTFLLFSEFIFQLFRGKKCGTRSKHAKRAKNAKKANIVEATAHRGRLAEREAGASNQAINVSMCMYTAAAIMEPWLLQHEATNGMHTLSILLRAPYSMNSSINISSSSSSCGRTFLYQAKTFIVSSHALECFCIHNGICKRGDGHKILS